MNTFNSNINTSRIKQFTGTIEDIFLDQQKSLDSIWIVAVGPNAVPPLPQLNQRTCSYSIIGVPNLINISQTS